MIEAILIAMFAAKKRRYKLKPLFLSWTIYPILLFTIILVAFNAQIFLGNFYFLKYSKILERTYLLTFLILIIKHRLYNSAIIGSICIFIGTLLNKIAISANGGKMPGFPTLSYITGYIKPDSFIKVNDIHVLGNASTNLKFLTDIFDIGYSILSIGDVFIRAFIFIIIYNTIKCVNKTAAHVSSAAV